eukprot:CAMPEP_0170280322 /NCGR_PEP_ID=MMETSP0116_2-20130129/40172_1 /TAXON_ID=400756 /ORGANISM="Durinskia baltica, Strain CSIRO CS-38" /LENGTH=370 /DNA_ID=CAMNT_0010531647 /DNA_START=15 /DNA_END=1124 /DNA_ORIENTATION=+
MASACEFEGQVAPTAMMSASVVPVIDISAFLDADAVVASTGGGGGGALPEAALEVARLWRQAFATQGFAQVIGHGVPDAAIEETYAVARRFFLLPAVEKQQSDLGLGYGANGYTKQGMEQVSATGSMPDGSGMMGVDRARPPDRVESFVVKGRSPQAMPAGVGGFRDAVLRYYDEMGRLLRSILRLTACSLDLPLDFFEQNHFSKDADGRLRCSEQCALRLAFYPRLFEGEEPLQGQLRYGEHTDYTGFTLLWQERSWASTAKSGLTPPQGGLQVRLPDGAWIDCPPVPGAFVVNAGDLIQVWTNDVFLSNTHRVLMPPPGDTSDRISLVFFTGPKKDTVIEALPTCCSPDRPPRYRPITSGEHLANKLA